MNGRRQRRAEQGWLLLQARRPVPGVAEVARFAADNPGQVIEDKKHLLGRIRTAEARAFGAEARLKIVEGERDNALRLLIELRKRIYQAWNESRPIQ